MYRNLIRYSISLLTLTLPLAAEVWVPSIFSDHMVLQREQSDPVWGKAEPGEAVTVKIADQSHATTADADGKWIVNLDPMEAGGPFELVIEGTNTITFTDVLIGEVWVCSGQSNMEHPVVKSNNADVEIASATNSMIRMITVPRVATQEPQDDFDGKWEVCSPRSVKAFSGVGYFFGRRIQEATGVPVGLVDTSWGGASAEGWIPRDYYAQTELTADLLAKWDERVAAYSDAEHTERLAQYQSDIKEWEAGGKEGNKPSYPEDPRKTKHRPANIYNGMINPIVGYGIQGFIWYQGESNARRAKSYQTVFPLMITALREEWGEGDFPFYWVQLADFQMENSDPNANSSWAEVREAQTMTLSLPNTGQAVIIDVGEGRDIHPRDKQTPADRLARWALANDYGIDMHFQSPTYKSVEFDGNKAVLTFDHVSDKGLYAFDTSEVKGFSIAGEDKVFYWADAKIVDKNKVEVSSPENVPHPVAVRYGWAQNPVINLEDRNGLPVTPFRTDDRTNSTE